jgi:hypothetical protein
MSITEEVLTKLRGLPEEKQRLVLRYVETLDEGDGTPTDVEGIYSVEGLWADLGLTITEEDIAEARREMWGNFPRENV